MSCPFCQIVRGEKLEEVLYRNERFCVFAPATRAPGKFLVVPVEHYEALSDIPMGLLGQWLTEARDLATRLGIGKFKMQINVGSEYLVRHMYMQFHFDPQHARQKEVACHRSFDTTGKVSPIVQTGDRGRSLVSLRRPRTT